MEQLETQRAATFAQLREEVSLLTARVDAVKARLGRVKERLDKAAHCTQPRLEPNAGTESQANLTPDHHGAPAAHRGASQCATLQETAGPPVAERHCRGSAH